MKLVKAKITITFLCLFLLGCAFLLDVAGMVRPGELAAPSEGVPTIAKRENDLLLTGISQVVTDGDHIYVLFGTYGVVQTYSMAGKYQYSVSVYNHSNGRIQIAAENGSLYIADKRGNVYVFTDGSFSEYLNENESDAIARKLKFGVSDSDYTVKRSSVWRISDNTCVIRRPDWLVLYQGNISWLFKFFLIITIGWVISFPSPKKKQENKA